MRKFLLTIILLAILFFMYPRIQEKVKEADPESFIGTIQTEMEESNIPETLNKFFTNLQFWTSELKGTLNEQVDESRFQNIKKPQLLNPVEQTFSVYNIQIGDSLDEVEAVLGSPKRVGLNGYEVHWRTYHESYQNFVMVAFDSKENVVALYTNQDLIASSVGITLNTLKDQVRAEFGEPLEGIKKGWTIYQTQNNGEYDLYEMNGNYVTIFYDKHENNTVTAIQIIDKDLELKKDGIYGVGSSELAEAFAYQLFDVTNATRVNHGLTILEWDDMVKETAVDHSRDMAENNFFGHTNLAGQSPFDRMDEDGIDYRMAGENLAAGQTSSIFAHEGLMNSEGHRKNILQPDFRLLGVGVAFSEDDQPYFTENFYTR
ncbi:CAP domain-containing protein [Bacillaceae bacterium S4-13-56]